MRRIEINHDKKAIIITKEFKERAADEYSCEYEYLQEVKASHPTYAVRTRREVTPNLTYDFMYEYVETFDQDGDDILNFMNIMVNALVEHGLEKGPVYEAIKDYFIRHYPKAIKKFKVDYKQCDIRMTDNPKEKNTIKLQRTKKQNLNSLMKVRKKK